MSKYYYVRTIDKVVFALPSFFLHVYKTDASSPVTPDVYDCLACLLMSLLNGKSLNDNLNALWVLR